MLLNIWAHAVCRIQVQAEIGNVFEGPMHDLSLGGLGSALSFVVLLFLLFLLELVLGHVAFHDGVSKHLLQVHVALLIRVHSVVIV